jgi:murein DD-endopeptidase MepM/ murein hydrolase activator NlpD
MDNRAPIHRRITIGSIGAFILFVCLLLSISDSHARPAQLLRSDLPEPVAMGGGSGPVAQDELTPEQYQRINAQLADSRKLLALQGKLQVAQAAAPALFAWPLQQIQSMADYGYHGISNFVDHNPVVPNQLLDYNNGTRTYDLESGYNHRGTDIYLWPFAWQKMDAGEVEVVAAASGTIVYKSDGNFDRSCGFNNNDWNAVYIQHSDGSIAWYGHLKKGSVTTKLRGDTVVTGEYLGVVGSSGSSSGPHLHFEVYDPNGILIDPFAGPANPTISQSLWNTQLPYYNSAVNHLGIGSAAPVFPTCPNPEISSEKASFDPGTRIYFTTYYRDQLAGQISQYRIYRPNNSLYTSWTHSSSAEYYSSSYWYWNLVIPVTAPRGPWRFEVTFQGHTYQRTFFIGPVLTPHVVVPLVRR